MHFPRSKSRLACSNEFLIPIFIGGSALENEREGGRVSAAYRGSSSLSSYIPEPRQFEFFFFSPSRRRSASRLWISFGICDVYRNKFFLVVLGGHVKLRIDFIRINFSKSEYYKFDFFLLSDLYKIVSNSFILLYYIIRFYFNLKRTHRFTKLYIPRSRGKKEKYERLRKRAR